MIGTDGGKVGSTAVRIRRAGTIAQNTIYIVIGPGESMRMNCIKLYLKSGIII